MVRALLVSVCLFSLAGCGSGSGNAARNDCYDFVENQYCPALLFCGATAYTSTSDCIGFFESSGNTVLDCDTVTVEYSGLGACEAQVNDSYCDELVTASGYAELPAVCAGVFN
jgi:Tfp pilus assembly protein PilW